MAGMYSISTYSRYVCAESTLYIPIPLSTSVTAVVFLFEVLFEVHFEVLFEIKASKKTNVNVNANER